MIPELHNRIHNELKDFLNREPTENEIMNSQTDINIMQKIKDRLNTEEKGITQDQIDSLQIKIDKINLIINSVIK